MNILFLCSRNKIRSLTAENIFKNSTKFQVRSAGTEPSARIKVTQGMVNWADYIFVMEKHHRSRLVQKFSNSSEKRIIVLNIEDIYEPMEDELISHLKSSVESHIPSDI